MWLEIALAGCAVFGLGFAGWGATLLFPAEAKRLGRIVRAEIGDRIPGARRRPTIELALHAGVEVDMKWWDEEFAKIKRSRPTPHWEKMVAREYDLGTDLSSLSRSIRDATTPTTAELDRWSGLAARGIATVTENGVTYDVRQMDDYARVQARAAFEAQKKRLIQSLTEHPGVKDIPRDESIKLRAQMSSAQGQAELQNVKNRVLAAAKLHTDVKNQCQDCEYVEHRTYADQYTVRHRTKLCWRCEQEKLDAIQRASIRGIYTANSGDSWNLD